ncbi:MAG: hypothetical protein N2D54_04305 [Chloroflexota bacterium]
MDPLVIIVGLMSALLFSYLGYVAGNYFPLIKRKDKGISAPQFEFDSQPASDEPEKPPFLAARLEAIKKWYKVLENKVEGIEPTESSDATEPPESADNEKLQDDKTIEETLEQPVAEEPKNESPAALESEPASDVVRLEDSTRIWHDRKNHKIYTEAKGKIVDLDDSLPKNLQGDLSFLLVDLQDKIGISAALKSSLEEKIDESIAKEKVDDLEIKQPSFNPVKSFVSFLQSDVPKLEEEQASIPAQINAIFQENIKDSELTKQRIRIKADKSGGVAFHIGDNSFQSVHDIPDDVIRNAILDAVKQWEDQ